MNSHFPLTLSGFVTRSSSIARVFAHIHTVFSHSHYICAYLISGVNCHLIHAQVRFSTHPHTYHTGISTEHFSRSQGSPPPPKPTFQLQLPEQPQVLRYTYHIYLPHHPLPTSQTLNWKLNWHNNPLTQPVSHPPTFSTNRYPDPGFSTSLAQKHHL